MGLRFRKRTKLFPGVFLNFSKSGISTNFGIPGASISLSKQGTHLNAGLPGSGFYTRTKIGEKKLDNNNEEYDDSYSEETFNDPSEKEIKTENIEGTTSKTFLDLSEMLSEVYEKRTQLKNELYYAIKDVRNAVIINIISKILIFGFFSKFPSDNLVKKKQIESEIREDISNTQIEIKVNFEKDVEDKYNAMQIAFLELKNSEKIWDITTSKEIDQNAERSAASESISRTEVNLRIGNLNLIKSEVPSFYFENANGGNLYLFPSFLIIIDSNNTFGIIDIKDLSIDFNTIEFVESEEIPEDSMQIGTTWYKVNKNGGQDKRFKDNFEIPIAEYGSLRLTSLTGLNELYYFSNKSSTENFSAKFSKFKSSIKV